MTNLIQEKFKETSIFKTFIEVVEMDDLNLAQMLNSQDISGCLDPTGNPIIDEDIPAICREWDINTQRIFLREYGLCRQVVELTYLYSSFAQGFQIGSAS